MLCPKKNYSETPTFEAMTKRIPSYIVSLQCLFKERIDGHRLDKGKKYKSYTKEGT